MEVIAVRRAAVLLFFRLELINPSRTALDLDFVTLTKDRYHFLKYPQTYSEFTNTQDGLVFAMGRWGDSFIEEIRIFPNGILVATGESTDQAEAVFADLVALLPTVGLMFSDEMVTQRTYISQLVVRSDMDLARINEPIHELLAATFGGQTGLGALGFFTQGNSDTTPVRIERLAGAPLSSNQYWTQAPISTSRHLEFLDGFERAIAASATAQRQPS